jgi:hypothetical protein
MKHAFVRLAADSVVEAIRSAPSNPAMLALTICVAMIIQDIKKGGIGRTTYQRQAASWTSRDRDLHCDSKEVNAGLALTINDDEQPESEDVSCRCDPNSISPAPKQQLDCPSPKLQVQLLGATERKPFQFAEMITGA